MADPLPPQADRIIGANIRALREHKGYTQTALAQKLGVTFQQLQKYESGRNRLTAARLYLLARHFNVPGDYFFHGLGGVETGPDMPLLRRDPDALEAMRILEAMPDPALRRKLVKALHILAA